jgi:hypothetical protein
MKRIFIIVLLCTLFFACAEKGTSDLLLNGTEETLPLELQGLKVYTVKTRLVGGTIKVAILNNEIVSTTNRVNKNNTNYTVIIKKPFNKAINVSQILLENDSIIIFRK